MKRTRRTELDCRSCGRKSRWQRKLFQTEEPTIEKVLFCLVAVRACIITKSHLEVERRNRRPEQAEVKPWLI